MYRTKKALMVVCFVLLMSVIIFSGNSLAQPKRLVLGMQSWFLGCSFDQGQVQALKDKIEKINSEGKYNIELLVVDSQGKREKQFSDIEDFLAKKVDILICHVNDSSEALGWKEIVEQVRKETGKPLAYGITKLPYGDVTADDLGVDFAVSSDDYVIGMNVGKFIAAYLYGKKGKFAGNIVELRGEPGASCDTLRHQGLHKVLDEYPQIKTVFNQTHHWRRLEAQRLMETVLTKFPPGTIDAVYAYFDDGAMGVLAATEEANRLGEFLIFGSDGQTNLIRAIQEGKVTATAVFDYRAASKALSMAIDRIEGKPVPKTYVMPDIFITQGNVWEVLKTYEPFRSGEDIIRR